MTKEELCAEIADILETEDTLFVDSDLTHYNEFDSLAIMSIIALVSENFEKEISGIELQRIKTPAELIKLIGESEFR